MFVHGIKDDRPLVLMLKKDELGQALRDNVREKCPKLPSSFILLHQGRKVLYPGGLHLNFFILSLEQKFPFFIHLLSTDSTSFTFLTVSSVLSTAGITKVKMSIPTNC